MGCRYKVSFKSKASKKRLLTNKYWNKKNNAQKYADDLNKYFKRNARVVKVKKR